MEQTAVEWLIEQLTNRQNGIINDLSHLSLDQIYNIAKEIEQKQNQEIRQKSYMEGYDEGLYDALNK
jgi:hypothetical protein